MGNNCCGAAKKDAGYMDLAHPVKDFSKTDQLKKRKSDLTSSDITLSRAKTSYQSIVARNEWHEKFESI